MPLITRRRCLQNLALVASAPVWNQVCGAAEKPSSQQESDIARLVRDFLQKHQVPGLSVAFASQGTLVYAEGFGLADPAGGEKVTSSHRFRIASVSKPFTSVAIHLLLEQEKLKLDDKVFGGLIEIDLSKAASASVADITVRHLLTHTGGGWANDRNDPMFQHAEMNHAELIARTIQTHPLTSEPGKTYAYSNFGYCVLGRVIEKLTGKSYAEFVRQAVLEPCGIKDMQIAGNTLAERAPGEVVYVGSKGQDPYRMNVRRMDSHGGWLAMPEDLVRFFTHVDGFPSTADLLHEATIKSMTTATAANPGYACGFSVNSIPNWWHGGSLPGTSTIAVRTASGMCWAGFANARSEGIGLALDRLMWQIARTVPEWKA